APESGVLSRYSRILPVGGSTRPSVFDIWPVYQSAPSGATAGSCGWELEVGTSHSLMMSLASEAPPEAPWAIAACLASKRAARGFPARISPSIRTTAAATIIAMPVRRIENLPSRLRLLLNTSRGGSRWFLHQACLAPR